jgi:hypothetical protein
MTPTRHPSASGELAPVTHRRRWVGGGLTLQAIGTAIPLAIGYDRDVREGLGGHVTLATVRLVWHQMIHDHHDLIRIVLGVVLLLTLVALATNDFDWGTETGMGTRTPSPVKPRRGSEPVSDVTRHE